MPEHNDDATRDEWEETESELQGEWEQPGGADLPGESEDPEAYDLLASLRGAPRVQIWRTKPAWCKGLITNVDLAADEELDLGQLREDFGGGTYMLRPMAYKPGHGWQYRSGAVSVPIRGEPRDDGLPIRGQSRQQVIDVAARETRPALRTPTDPRGMELLAGLFDRITDRLDRLEQRVGMTAPPADPLAEVKRAAEMVHALRGLAGVFAGTDEPGDLDDDDDDDDEADEPPSPEGLIMRLLEKKIDEGQQPQQPAPAAPRARLIKAPPPPAAPAPRVAEPEPAPEPAPEAAPVELLRPEADPWTDTVPEELRRDPGGAAAVAVEAEPAPTWNVEQVATALRGLPTEQAMEILNEAITKLPPDQVVAWIQRMQQER